MARKPAPPPATRISGAQRLREWIEKRAAWVSLALMLIGTIRIGLTWQVFHHTSDEPAHVACGMEWLERGNYRFETQHPPLSRIFAAFGARLDGAHMDPQDRADIHDTMWWNGSVILFRTNSYEHRIAAIRAAMLPFFWLGGFAVFLWGRRLLGPLGAALSVFLYSMLPLVLAHSGLATTDMALTSTFTLAAYALVILLETPNWRHAIFCGLALGLMLIAKFSGIPYFIASAGLACAWWLWKKRSLRGLMPRIAWLSVSAVIAFFIIWATYRFSFGRSPLFPFPTPFPEWFDGIHAVMEHNKGGHPSYFLGTVMYTGSWLFFPLLFLVKTPLPVLLLFAAAFFLRPKQLTGYGWLPWAVVAGVMAVAVPARINIGLRHVLPMFPFVCVLAAGAAAALWERASEKQWAGAVLAFLLVWLAAGSLRAHPDYLADFNLLAGDHPENITVDSDLDWGQDILRLRDRLRELHAPSVNFTATIYTSFATLGFPPVTPNDPSAPGPGWNAVSLMYLKLFRMSAGPEGHRVKLWPELLQPTEVVGKSILLFYVPPR